MTKLYIADVEVFQKEFEANLCSGTYLWVDDNHILYNEERHDLFENDLDIEEISEYTPIELVVL